jgi:hypothetical protein
MSSIAGKLAGISGSIFPAVAMLAKVSARGSVLPARNRVYPSVATIIVQISGHARTLVSCVAQICGILFECAPELFVRLLHPSCSYVDDKHAKQSGTVCLPPMWNTVCIRV